MKHKVNLHGIWRLELECHYVDLFHDGEWVKFLLVQFFQWASCFDVLLSKPNLISNFEIWLVFMMFVNIFLVLPSNLFKAKYKLCLNVY
jgi:hypothetical protein